MPSNLQKGAALFLKLFLLLGPCFATAEAIREVVKIGVIAPLTGGEAQTGDDIVKTLKLQANWYNSTSTKYQYELFIEDGKCGAGNLAITAAGKLLEADRVDFLITSCSGETLQVAPLANRKKIIQVASWSSHKDVKTAGDYTFRTFVDIERGIFKLSSLIKEQHKQIVILAEDITFTVGVGELLRTDLKDKVAYFDFFPYDQIDLRSLLLKAKSKNPDAYFFAAASTKTQIAILKQAQELGINEQIYGFYFPEYPEVINAIGPHLDGLIFLGHAEIKNACPDFIKFLDKWRQTYRRDLLAETAVRASYDAFQVLYDTIEKAGKNTEQVKEALYKYQGQGAQGPLSFDKNGDLKDLNWDLKIYREGKPRLYVAEKAPDSKSADLK